MRDLPVSYLSNSVTFYTALLSCLAAFALAMVIAKVYERTCSGLSSSRSLTHAMALGSVVTAVLMLAIGDNLARGIGIVGSLAIIRFRTNLRDPRELVFVFAALGTGVAAGVQSYVTPWRVARSSASRRSCSPVRISAARTPMTACSGSKPLPIPPTANGSPNCCVPPPAISRWSPPVRRRRAR